MGQIKAARASAESVFSIKQCEQARNLAVRSALEPHAEMSQWEHNSGEKSSSIYTTGWSSVKNTLSVAFPGEREKGYNFI